MARFIFWSAVVWLCSWSIRSNAATCVQEDNLSGHLVLTGDPLAECTGHVLMDATEYSQVPTLQALFAWPESDQMVSAWMAGFTLPMICYLAAWAFGTVVNFFKPDNERF